MEFEIYTQDGFKFRGKKVFKTLEELMEFVKLNAVYGGISMTEKEIYIMNCGKEDLF